MTNLFEVDFLNKLTTLLKEAFAFKKYKAMHGALAVFTGILMLPIVLASFAVTAAFATISFIFSVFSMPVKYWHTLVRNEKDGVKHATQFIIYFISWPYIFAAYIFMSFLLFLMLPIYALLSFLCFVWSLGGFKFHLFPTQYEDISIEVEGKLFYLPLVFIILGGMVAFFIPAIHGVIRFVDLYNAYLEKLFFPIFFGSIYPTYIAIHSSFAVLYSLIGFSHHPKAAKKKD